MFIYKSFRCCAPVLLFRWFWDRFIVQFRKNDPRIAVSLSNLKSSLGVRFCAQTEKKKMCRKSCTFVWFSKSPRVCDGHLHIPHVHLFVGIACAHFMTLILKLLCKVFLFVPFSNHCQCWPFCRSGVVSFEACCQWALLSVQIIGLVTLPFVSYTFYTITNCQ